jgi:hypothetical protein
MSEKKSRVAIDFGFARMIYLLNVKPWLGKLPKKQKGGQA